jgi:hypothetical protein
MIRFHMAARLCCCLVLAGFGAGSALAQSAGSSAQHLRFDSPEAWALKYFTSSTLLSGLRPPEGVDEERRTGSINIGFELGWIPELNSERARVGFSGRKMEDVSKAPLLARPVLRVGLPWKLSLLAAGPPPVRVFGVTPRLFAFGLERPILERRQWTLSWRGYGQVGSAKSSFTCPKHVLGFPAGSPNNPSGCIGESSDIAYLRYAGTEVGYSYRIPKMPKVIPHLAGGINFIDGAFQVNAPLQTRFDRTRMWTHGKTFSGTAGISYLFTDRVALTVDAFYTPLSVRRQPNGPRTNDGLFNLRALISYTIR